MPGGRPKKKIDYETVEKLASMMCTQEEIGSYLDISPRTLQKDDKFLRIYKRGLDKGRMSVRRQQYQAAQDGNVTMQIWLGKNYLGQSDKQSVEHSGGLDNTNTELTPEERRERINALVSKRGNGTDTTT